MSETLTNREKIQQLGLHDALVHKHLTLAVVHDLNWVETLELLVLNLAESNKAMNDRLLREIQRCPVPHIQNL